MRLFITKQEAANLLGRHRTILYSGKLKDVIADDGMIDTRKLYRYIKMREENRAYVTSVREFVEWLKGTMGVSYTVIADISGVSYKTVVTGGYGKKGADKITKAFAPYFEAFRKDKHEQDSTSQ